jgi:hypothetical protein
MSKNNHATMAEKPGKEFFGKTELTYEFKKILQNYELISHVKSEGHTIYFYIIGKKRQGITGRLKDVKALLKEKKVFCKISHSCLVNMIYVFVWCVNNDGLRLLMRTDESSNGTIIEVNVRRYDDAIPEFTFNGIDKYELQELLQKGIILSVSENGKKDFKKKEKNFPHIKRLYQAIERKPEIER